MRSATSTGAPICSKGSSARSAPTPRSDRRCGACSCFSATTSTAATLDRLRFDLADRLPAPHHAFFRSLRIAHREGGCYFVHAGILPGVPLEEQSDRDRMWIRDRFLDSTADHGVVVVHGHSITRGPEVRPNRIGIDTGAWRTGVLTCLVLDGDERAFLST